MAYFYVDNDGTATLDAGRFASKQTGSFTALGVGSAYVSITAALAATTAPASGDFIVCSEFYAFDNGAVAIGHVFPGTGKGITCISVDDTAIDSYKFGAKEQTTQGIKTSGKALWVGFTHQTSLAIQSNINATVAYKDSLLVLGSSSDQIQGTVDGAYFNLIDCEVSCASTTNEIRLQSGARLDMTGGSFTATTSVTDLLADNGGGAGGFTLNMFGVDLSVITGTLITVGDNQTGDNAMAVTFDGCKLASGVAISVGLTNSNQVIKLTRCTNVSASAEYQYYYEEYTGTIIDDDVIFRNEDEPFTESNQKISYKITTTADCGIGMPFAFDFPVLRYSALSAGATDTLRFYLTSNTALTDNDFYIEVLYPDGTNKQTFNLISSQDADYFAAGTALDPDTTSTWTGVLSNKYQIDVSTSGDVGADCQPIVKVYVAKASIVIQLASEFGLN